MDLGEDTNVSNERYQKEFDDFKFVIFVPFFFIPFFLIFYIIFNGIEKGLIWFSFGLIASGLILAFIIIFSFTGINSQIESAVHSITENNAVLYEVLYNLAISFINSVRNTGFIFAGIGIAITAAIRIKKGTNKLEEQTEMQNL